MLRSLIVQLVVKHQAFPEPLEALFKSCHNGKNQPQMKDLEKLLKTLIESHEKIYLVLDALDECENRHELVGYIEKAVGRKSAKLNVVMTSRRLRLFEELFDAGLEEWNRLSIQNEKVDEDIRSYIHEKLRSDRRFKRWQNIPGVQEEIETALMEKSDGM